MKRWVAKVKSATVEEALLQEPVELAATEIIPDATNGTEFKESPTISKYAVILDAEAGSHKRHLSNSFSALDGALEVSNPIVTLKSPKKHRACVQGFYPTYAIHY